MALNESLAQLRELDGWSLNDAGHIHRDYSFEDFAQALAFANSVGRIAEKQGHHPNINIAWGRCTVEVWTHKISGLTQNDFIVAAKFDEAFRGHAPMGRLEHTTNAFRVQEPDDSGWASHLPR